MGTSTATVLIDNCPHCGAHTNEISKFCTGCGTALTVPHSLLEPTMKSHAQAGQPNVHGFSQMLGVHPFPGVLTLAANTMLFTGTVFTMGALIPVALGVAVVLGIITYRAQIKLYGDEPEVAALKAVGIALITAIPVGLPAFLTIPSTIVGLVHTLRRKE